MLLYQCFFLNFFFTIYFGRHILMTRWLFNLAFSVLFSRKNWRQKTKKLKCEMEKIKGSRGGEMVYASGTRNEIFGCVLWWKNGSQRAPFNDFSKWNTPKACFKTLKNLSIFQKSGPIQTEHPNSRSQVPNLSTIETCKWFHWIRWAPFLYKKHKKKKK